MRTVLITFVLLALLAAAVVLWMAGGAQGPKVTRPEPIHLERVVPKPHDGEDPGLTVVTWNIAWAYGWGSEGSGGARPKAHFQRTLEEMARVLGQFEPDVVLLQEVDFDATRSHHLDQAIILAESLGLPYLAKAESWRANWVPFPYWPPEDHFGAMSSGGAILSRFPITDHQVETVDKPEANPWWYNLFYLFRYHQQAVLQTDGGPLLVVNVHTEAFDREHRVRHARRLANKLSEELVPGAIVGGDFNSVLPEASQREGYEDEPETTHQDDPTIEIVRDVTGLVDAVPSALYLQNEAAWFTFPSHQPNRKLDYLFHGAGLRVGRVEVPRAIAGDLSDHLPLVARLVPLGEPATDESSEPPVDTATTADD